VNHIPELKFATLISDRDKGLLAAEAVLGGSWYHMSILLLSPDTGYYEKLWESDRTILLEDR